VTRTGDRSALTDSNIRGWYRSTRIKYTPSTHPSKSWKKMSESKKKATAYFKWPHLLQVEYLNE
jgi:hypothetical protein